MKNTVFTMVFLAAAALRADSCDEIRCYLLANATNHAGTMSNIALVSLNAAGDPDQVLLASPDNSTSFHGPVFFWGRPGQRVRLAYTPTWSCFYPPCTLSGWAILNRCTQAVLATPIPPKTSNIEQGGCPATDIFPRPAGCTATANGVVNCEYSASFNPCILGSYSSGVAGVNLYADFDLPDSTCDCSTTLGAGSAYLQP